MFDLQPAVLSIGIVTISLSALFLLVGCKFKHLKPTTNPKGLIQIVIMYVEFITNMVYENMGEKHGKKFAAYLGSVFIYLLFANTIGLFGFETPTSNLSVTLMFAFITWVLIQAASIEASGWKGYFKGFFDPIFPFVIPNFFGTMAPLISLSMRMFGNVLSGGIIMMMLYAFTGWLSSFIPLIGGINIIGVFVTPIIHLYFDLFSGFLQAFIFLSLTMVLISVKYTE